MVCLRSFFFRFFRYLGLQEVTILFTGALVLEGLVLFNFLDFFFMAECEGVQFALAISFEVHSAEKDEAFVVALCA